MLWNVLEVFILLSLFLLIGQHMYLYFKVSKDTFIRVGPCDCIGHIRALLRYKIIWERDKTHACWLAVRNNWQLKSTLLRGGNER